MMKRAPALTKGVIWACAVTLGIDLAITELWFDLRPIIFGVAEAEDYPRPPHWLPRCDMEDGKDIDYAMLWRDKEAKCVDLARGQVRG